MFFMKKAESDLFIFCLFCFPHRVFIDSQCGFFRNGLKEKYPICISPDLRVPIVHPMIHITIG